MRALWRRLLRALGFGRPEAPGGPYVVDMSAVQYLEPEEGKLSRYLAALDTDVLAARRVDDWLTDVGNAELQRRRQEVLEKHKAELVEARRGPCDDPSPGGFCCDHHLMFGTAKPGAPLGGIINFIGSGEKSNAPTFEELYLTEPVLLPGMPRHHHQLRVTGVDHWQPGELMAALDAKHASSECNCGAVIPIEAVNEPCPVCGLRPPPSAFRFPLA